SDPVSGNVASKKPASTDSSISRCLAKLCTPGSANPHRITLVFAAKDTRYTNAVALRDFWLAGEL
ncbi:MAG: hypothetical protein R3303_02650, partial [Marinobacter sp.]|nr:hypothetical protein [Marinobacter sp.]